MSEFFSSITAWYKERTTSSLYGTYTICFILWNWKIIYTYFFQEAGIIKVPTIEYVQKLMFFTGDVSWYKDIFNELWLIVPPMFFTYLIIKFIPRPNKWAFDLNVRNFYERKKISDSAKLAYEKGKNKNLTELAEVKEKQINIMEKIDQNTSEEEKWDLEYIDFEKHDLSSKFSQVLKTLYTNNGFVEGNQRRFVDVDILALVHAQGLIKFLNGGTNRIELTPKGQYFSKLFLKKNNLSIY